MILTALIILFASVSLFNFIKKLWRNSKALKLPPGPIRWPLLGCIPQMLMEDLYYPYRQVMGLKRKYGDVMSIGLGVHFAVVISSFELMKDVLKHPDATLERYRFQFSDQRTDGKNLGIIWSGGESWKKLRKYTVKKLKDFGFGKGRSMEEAIQEEVTSLLNQIQKESEASDGVWRVDARRLSVVSINIIWSCIGGYRFDPESTMIQDHIALNSEIFEIARPTNLLSAFPFLKMFPRMSGYTAQGKIHKTCREFMQNSIDQVKLQRTKGRSAESQSFLEVFLDDCEKHGGKNEIREEQLVIVLMDLFLAGSESTSIAMNWIILYMALNQTVQANVRSEIWKASEEGTKPIHLTDSKALPRVRAFILETMRHSPLATLPLPRQARVDMPVGEYTIPKGACILYNLYAIFHDPLFWEDPEIFRPDRFLDHSGMHLNPLKVERVAQFGFGKRICPGEGLVMDTLFVFIVSLLSHFSIDAVEGKSPSLDPGVPALTIGPQPYAVTVERIDGSGKVSSSRQAPGSFIN